MLYDLHQAAEVGQDGTAHEDGDLLHDLDASVSGLPGLFALAHGFEEGQQRGDAQGGGHHGEGPGGGVSDVLVHVVDVGTHGGDHGGQAGSLHARTGQRRERVEQIAFNLGVIEIPVMVNTHASIEYSTFARFVLVLLLLVESHDGSPVLSWAV